MADLEWYIVFAAFALDFIIGDPVFLPHPVVFMGRAISWFEIRFRKWISDPLKAGSLFACFLITATWLTGWGIIRAVQTADPMLGIAVQAVLLFFCFSSKSLTQAAMAVYDALKSDSLEKAREKVGWIVGRQTSALDEAGVTRAAVETVAENFVDGFLSPLFFACIGGVPLALAYKMVNTLDSMVGYKNETYILFGRAAARIDDAANFIPARLSVAVIAVSMSLISVIRGRRAFSTAVSQGRRHKSPNAGYPEAAFAGALGVRMGGPNIYHGKLVEKPYIGDMFPDPSPVRIRQACDLMMLASLTAAAIACVILYFL